MMVTREIRREEGENSGRYVIDLPDGREAEMTYKVSADRGLVIDHTYVPPEYRSEGLAYRLVEQAVSDARASGARITPLCSYVAAQFRRHPEWSDLRA